MAGHVTRMEDGRNAFKILTGKPTEIINPVPRPCVTFLNKDDF